MPVENILRACGHVQEFHWNDSEPDLEHRKAKYAAGRCRACNHDLNQQNQQAHAAKLARRDATRKSREERQAARQRQHLRDEFARMALMGMMADENCFASSLEDVPAWRVTVARDCYALADAMLKERDKSL